MPVSVCKFFKLACMLFRIVLWFRRLRADFSTAYFPNHFCQYLNTFLFMIFFYSTLAAGEDAHQWSCLEGRNFWACYWFWSPSFHCLYYTVMCASFIAHCLMMTFWIGPGLVNIFQKSVRLSLHSSTAWREFGAKMFDFWMPRWVSSGETVTFELLITHGLDEYKLTLGWDVEWCYDGLVRVNDMPFLIAHP